jgi:mannose-1-phosphate guanylyltransferase/mannose-6-phosphate isomerase
MNDELTIAETETLLEAMKKIDSGHKGFLVVVAGDMTVRRTLTDGDIRRALIAGNSVNDELNAISTISCTTLCEDRTISDAVDVFANLRIEFLPIVDRNNKLVNILTEQELKLAFLKNLEFDLHYNFTTLDENELKHSIVAKPWGFYQVIAISEFYQAKVLSVSPRSCVSLQVHQLREEYWLVVSGNGEAQIGDSFKSLTPGTVLFVPKNCKHRLFNNSDVESLITVEVQLGESFDESDIERLKDMYGR